MKVLCEELVSHFSHGLGKCVASRPEAELERRFWKCGQGGLVDTLSTAAPRIVCGGRKKERGGGDQRYNVFDFGILHESGHAEFHLDAGSAMERISIAYAATMGHGRTDAMIDRGQPDGHAATIRVPEKAYAVSIYLRTACKIINTYAPIVQDLCKKCLATHQT
jgi:hypothetical protein